MRSKQSGFTLVEIAIVLVIIGLLLGGVLKGQELINSAKVKNFAGDIRNISTFIYAYQDRFRALPGDDPRADTNFNPAGTLGPVATRGNARINGAWNVASITDETALFWQHVRLAGLASGTSAVSADAANEYYPRNADGGRIGVTGDQVFTGAPVWAANFFVCMSGVQGRFVRQLDLAGRAAARPTDPEPPRRAVTAAAVPISTTTSPSISSRSGSSLSPRCCGAGSP
jgi:prepilin-type N-terminal cleavage/methylation domain-containing protein